MSIRVAAVQLEFQYFNSPQEFADAARAPIELAAQHGAQLIVLPHQTAFMLFGMFDFDADGMTRRFSEGSPLDKLSLPDAAAMPAIRAWLRERAPYVYEFYLHLFQSLASRAQVWLVPGTVLEPDGDDFFISACVFNPAGEVVGRQHQMHRTAQEIAWGVKQGDALRVFATELGDFGLVVGEDVRYPETARALALNGARILLHPAAYDAATFRGNESEQFLQDLWRDVQANQTFGVQATLLGEKYRGHSAIYAPVELTNDGHGILTQAQDNTAQILLADLDFEKLAAVRRAYPILDGLNPALDAQVSNTREE